MALTESWLKAQCTKTRKKELVKSDRDSLYARVSPKGKVTFAVRYYYDKKRKRLDLSSYPLMSLQEARNECIRLRKELEQGHDPKIVRVLEKQAIIGAKSLEDFSHFGMRVTASVLKKDQKRSNALLKFMYFHVLVNCP